VDGKDIGVLGPVLLVRIEHDFKATRKSKDVERIRGYGVDRICYRQQEYPSGKDVIPTNRRDHCLYKFTLFKRRVRA